MRTITDTQAPPSLITRNIPSQLMPSYLSIYQFQQCRLPGSVGSHQRHSRLQVNSEVKVLVHPWSLGGVAEADTLYHDHWGRDLTTVREREGDNLGARNKKSEREGETINFLITVPSDVTPSQPQCQPQCKTCFLLPIPGFMTSQPQ